MVAAPSNRLELVDEDRSQSARRRVLVSAYAISPVRGSEPGVGWQICSRLAQSHDVTVLCSPGVPGPDANYFRDEIAAFTARNGPVAGLTLHLVEPPLMSFLFQRETTLCRRTAYYHGYRAWQRRAYRVAADLHAQEPFDLIHQLNITGFREPGYLWKLNAPFVWGPIGGAPSLPKPFFNLLSRTDRLYYGFRNFTNRLQKSSRRCKAAANKARHIWAISSEDADMVSTQWHRPVETLLETGAITRTEGRARDYDGFRPLRLVWCGQHIGRKALPILLHALATLKDQSAIELTVIGDGPATPHWRALANSLGLKGIEWLGRVTHEQSLAALSSGDVLAFTSVLEGTPHVVLEAMSLGLPVICHNACGMGVAVTDGSGIRINMADSASSIRGFAEAIRHLILDPHDITRLSNGALHRAEELSWDSKVKRIVDVYERMVEKP